MKTLVLLANLMNDQDKFLDEPSIVANSRRIESKRI